jgi:hypothetical protein
MKYFDTIRKKNGGLNFCAFLRKNVFKALRFILSRYGSILSHGALFSDFVPWGAFQRFGEFLRFQKL